MYYNRIDKIYCRPYRLFGIKSVFATIDRSNWKKEKKILHIKNSITHKSCVAKMSQKGSVVAHINIQLILQVEMKKIYWEKVLTRVAAVVQCTPGLPLRGHDDKFGFAHSDNFIMILELIAEFDLSLFTHITQLTNKVRENTYYLSFETFFIL